jgi:hypothetical protein
MNGVGSSGAVFLCLNSTVTVVYSLVRCLACMQGERSGFELPNSVVRFENGFIKNAKCLPVTNKQA